MVSYYKKTEVTYIQICEYDKAILQWLFYTRNGSIAVA